MFLTFPRHEITSDPAHYPYSLRAFYNVTKYRDKQKEPSHIFFSRLVCEIAYAGLAAAAAIEAIARVPLVLVGLIFSGTPLKWIDAVGLCVVTSFFSLYSLITNLFIQKLKTHLLHLDLHLRNGWSVDFLNDAAANGRKDVVQELLKAGVDPHVPNHMGYTAAIAPTIMGHPSLEELFKRNPYEQDFLDLKLLSHWLGLEGGVHLGKELVPLEGSRSPWMFDTLAESLQRFRTIPAHHLLKIPDSKLLLLQDALYSAYCEHSYKKIAKKIQQKQLTFVQGGWQGHAICLAFCGNYMAICNRGEGADQHSTLEVFKIDPTQMSADLIEEILFHQHSRAHEGIDFFYQTLPSRLSSSQDSLCNAFKSIAPPYSRAAVCTLDSKKTAIRFAWAMLLSDHPSAEALTQARLESKLFLDWTAKTLLEEVRQFPNKFPTLHERNSLFRKAAEEGTKKKSRYKCTRAQLLARKFLPI